MNVRRCAVKLNEARDTLYTQEELPELTGWPKISAGLFDGEDVYR
jgi:hypothetical protein